MLLSIAVPYFDAVQMLKDPRSFHFTQLSWNERYYSGGEVHYKDSLLTVVARLAFELQSSITLSLPSFYNSE